ncbi:hypothetical protein HYPSUDRAFT_444027 [Hypholoma sublateritium FD-334 SS-4]|uniref:Uncharacterized protein n=1 Tax=Hypholoma sublateritium (strain FD-334 SS-4) TaxID=945553 RepID=A0A0D2N5I8_HYPSF|nr:hypothetical protein HYPSUDRAFT_444027 [Hypholoma sublateritium FD-334 SS-4]
MDRQLEPASGDIDIDKVSTDDDSLSESSTHVRVWESPNLLPLAFSMSGNTIGITPRIEHAPRAVRIRGDPELIFIEKTKRTISGREVGSGRHAGTKARAVQGFSRELGEQKPFVSCYRGYFRYLSCCRCAFCHCASVEDYCGSRREWGLQGDCWFGETVQIRTPQ